MMHIKVRWIHQISDMPKEICSELDEAGWEVRKVEIFADGRQSYASPVQSSGSSFLAECQFPSIDEIGKDPQFIPLVIAADEFERRWEIALGRNDFG